MVATNIGDPVVTRLVEEDKVKWYKKKNLRYLYFLLFPVSYFEEPERNV